MNDTELRTRVLADARDFDPASRPRSRLAPHREALLIYRAKGLSYEEISETLTRLGLPIRPTFVGTFCRRHFRKADVLRKRQELEAAPIRPAAEAPGAAPVSPFLSGRRGGRS